MLVATSLVSITNFRGKLLDLLQNQGHTISIILPKEFSHNDEIISFYEKGYSIHFIPLVRASISPLSDLKSSYHLCKIMKKEQPDFILSYTINPVIYGSIAAKIAGVKNIYSLIAGLGYAFISLEHANHKVTNLQKVVFSLYKMALFCSNKVIFQNSDDAELFEKMNLVNSKKINIVNGSGVDL